MRLDIPISISSGVVPRPPAGSLSNNLLGDFAAPPLYDCSAEISPTIDLPPCVPVVKLSRAMYLTCCVISHIGMLQDNMGTDSRPFSFESQMP